MSTINSKNEDDFQVEGFVERSMWNCDQCCKSRIRCCKAMLGCTSCRRKDISCTYNKEHKNQRVMGSHPEFFSHLSSFNIKSLSKPPEPEKKRTRRKRAVNSQLVVKNALLKVSESYQFRWVHMLKVWSHLNPSINSNCPGMETFLSIFTDVKKNALPPIKLLKSLSHLGQISLHPSSFPAIRAYFKYANPFLPLFTENDFLKQPRSHLLTMAVWVRGLKLIPNLVDESFRAGLQNQLLSELRKSYTKVSLDTLQAFLVTMNGLQSYQWSGVSTGLFYGAVVDMSHCLGLHLDLPIENFPSHIIYERKLAYSCVIYIDSLQAWAMDTHCMLQVDHISPRIFCTVPANCCSSSTNYEIQIKQRINSGKCHYRLCFDFLTDYMAFIAPIRQTMNHIRFRMNKNLSYKRNLSLTLKFLSNQMKQTFTFFMHAFFYLKKLDISSDINAIIRLCIIQVEVQFHSINHDMYNLNLSGKSQKDVKHISESNAQSLLQEAFYSAKKVIDLDATLGNEPYHMYRVQFLANSMVFLIKHYQSSLDNAIHLKRGLDSLSELSTRPTYVHMAVLAEALISKSLQVKNIKI